MATPIQSMITGPLTPEQRIEFIGLEIRQWIAKQGDDRQRLIRIAEILGLDGPLPDFSCSSCGKGHKPTEVDRPLGINDPYRCPNCQVPIDFARDRKSS